MTDSRLRSALAIPCFIRTPARSFVGLAVVAGSLSWHSAVCAARLPGADCRGGRSTPIRTAFKDRGVKPKKDRFFYSRVDLHNK
jgi:hypothetical protein